MKQDKKQMAFWGDFQNIKKGKSAILKSKLHQWIKRKKFEIKLKRPNGTSTI